jgi:hypothetical protein
MPQTTDLLFPRWQRELFNTILDEEKLKADREGQLRTAYGLRHTYICLRLMEGADISQIAKNCRTSDEMIEKYYASHNKTRPRLDAPAINIMLKKKVARKVAKETRSVARALYLRWPRGRGEMADAADLSKHECPSGNRRCRTAQSRGNLKWQSRAKPGSTSGKV